MATSNRASIEAKLQAWAKSNKGQAKMQKKINSYIDRDKRTTQAGGKVTTKKILEEAANDLANKISSAAYGVPGSVMANIESLTSEGAFRNDGGAVMCELSFTGDTTRPSLVPGEQVRTIIAIFDKGYTAHKQVVGYWHGMSIGSLTHREGIGFISDAVDEFIDDFSKKYDDLELTVSIYGDYA